MVCVGDCTTGLAAAVSALCAVDPLVLGDGETLVALHRQLERLRCAVTLATAAFDAGRSWEAEGARAASAWIATQCKVRVRASRRRVQLGRSLRHLPAAEAAWLAGDIGEAHVVLLAGARTPATAEYLDRDEAMLVGQARKLGYRQFARVLAYWIQLADPDGTDGSAESQHEARRLHLSQTFGGAWALQGLLDPIDGAIVSKALAAIEQELFDVDRAEVRTRVDGEVRASDLGRTPAQRRADALVEMARRSMAMPAGARLPEPLFSVLVGYETFAGRICELANCAVVAPGSLVSWGDQAWVERVVFDGPSRVKDVGVRPRVFTGATRRAVQVRDRECFHPFCDLAAERCQIDHVQPWSAGGLTTEANGRLACGFHNRERHRQRPPPAAA